MDTLPPTQGTPVFQAPAAGAPPSATPPPASSASAAPPPQPPGTVPPPSPLPVPPGPPGPNIKKLLLLVGGGLGLLVLIIIVIMVVGALFKPKADDHATLTYWGLYEDPRVMKVLIDNFERKHPEITINYEQQDPKQYRERLVTRIRNGNGPDIYRFHNSWVPMIKGFLLPLSADAVTPSAFQKAYYKVIQTDLMQNGAILGIPLGIDTLALYTNDQLFATQKLPVPNNWDDFVKTAAGLTTHSDDQSNKGAITTAGAALGTYDNVTHAPDIISLMLVQNQVDLYDLIAAQSDNADGQCNKLLACDALSFYTFFARGDNNTQRIWDGSLDPSVQAFAQGRLAMFVGYSWDLFTLQALNPGLAFSIHPIPQLNSADKKTIASYWVEGVSSKTKYPKAAMEFMKYLNDPQTQQTFFSENTKLAKYGTPYARVDLADSLKGNALLYPFVQQAQYAVSTPFVADTQDDGMNAALNGYLKNAVLQIQGNTSVPTALDTLNSGEKQILTQYGQ